MADQAFSSSPISSIAKIAVLVGWAMAAALGAIVLVASHAAARTPADARA
jgi:hypothetical protein